MTMNTKKTFGFVFIIGILISFVLYLTVLAWTNYIFSSKKIRLKEVKAMEQELMKDHQISKINVVSSRGHFCQINIIIKEELGVEEYNVIFDTIQGQLQDGLRTKITNYCKEKFPIVFIPVEEKFEVRIWLEDKVVYNKYL